MKRLSLLWLALTVAVGAAFAAPVDVNQAKSCGQKFVYNTLGQKSAELSLAYTCVSEAGTDALYVFNYGQGFVVVAADDRAYPILGYGTDQEFDVNDVPEGMRYYLNFYAREIQYAIDQDLPFDPEVAEQWYWVEKEGVVSKTRGEKVVNPLLTTLWNQDYPYNYYAPTSSSWWAPGGHCYAGCVATAMSQVMKFWNWPETGVGEHTYSSSSNGGTLSVNFGEATYNWSIMPNTLGSQANAQALAVALLMYHCGVAVDMDYAPDGSGAQTGDVPAAVIDHFRYGACTYMDSRDQYTKTAWEDKLIAELDRGIPMVYAGSDSEGGHAFNCDGYNAQRYFHFNWGWSGSYQSTYYQIDALNTGNGSFNMYQRAIFEMVPDYIYEAMVPAIETLTVDVSDAHSKTAVLHWTVPAQSVAGTDLESIEQIVLKRNGTVIQTYNNPQPGEEVTFEDQVADYGAYEYSILGINNGFEGDVFSQTLLIGPNCTWKFVCQTTNFQGWNDGILQVMNNGVVFKEVTMTNSSPLSEKFQMPEGEYSLNWVAPASAIASLTITLKNSAGQTAYTFSGSSTQLNGSFFTGANDCEGCQPPTNFAGEYHWTEEGFGTLLTWEYDTDPASFKVYRSTDGIEYEEVATVDKEAREYFDIAPAAEYYYKVTAFRSVCESTPAFTSEDTDYVYVSVTSVGEDAVNAHIFPNPAKNNLSIQANDINEVVMYNLMGQTVYRYNGRTNTLDINTSCLDSGIYTVNVVTANGLISKRVMVLH